VTRGLISFETIERRVVALDERWDRIRLVVSFLQKADERARGDRRGDFPSIGEARDRYDHGTEALYVLGRCRCFKCRVAHSAMRASQQPSNPWRLRYAQAVRTWYVQHVETREIALRTPERAEAVAKVAELNDRDGEPSPTQLIDAVRVRRHLRWLAENGIGPRTVHEVSGVSYSVICRIAHRKSAGAPINRTRRATAERILAVGLSDASGAQKVHSGPTRELVECLLAAGWRRWQIAVAVTPSSASVVQTGSRRDGIPSKRPGLQFLRNGSVRASTARKVEEVHREAWRTDPRVRATCQHERDRIRMENTEHARAYGTTVRVRVRTSAREEVSA
jgi:hypothetical protein